MTATHGEILKIAVLVSGNGTNLQSIIDHIAGGSLTASISAVISNRSDAFALQRAKRAGIPTTVIEERERERFEARLATLLQGMDIDYIVLAGFMRILSPSFVQKYPRRILNIHPALLPHFPGTESIKRAWEAGVSETGCTVHFVDEGVDTGPVISQKKVPVNSGETLEALTERIHAAEHQLYPEVLQQLAESKRKSLKILKGAKL